MHDPFESDARRAIDGDRRALERLLRELGPPMKAAIRAMVPPAETDDIVQNALVSFCDALTRFRFDSSVKHFACRVAVRQAQVHNRGRGRRKVREQDHGKAQMSQPPPPVNSTVVRDDLHRLLEFISEEQAETFVMRTVMGYSIEEIAAAQQIPANTVRSRLRAAKSALRKVLDEGGWP